MKIAIFSDFFYPELSGVVDSIVTTGFELAKRGHEIEYFVPKYGPKEYALGGAEVGELSLPDRVKVHRATSFSVSSPNNQGRGYMPNLFRGLEGKQFDVIHSHGFFGAGFDALCLAKTTDTPLIGTNHTLIKSFTQYLPVSGISGPLVSRYLIWYYNHCDFVTAPTDFLLEDMRDQGLRARGTAVSNPIDLPFFEKAADKKTLKNELGLSDKTFLYVGRLSVEKNVEMMLGAFIPFARKHADAMLVMVGGGMLRETLQKTITESGLSAQIKIAGPFVGPDKQTVYDYFRSSDVFVIPSTSETQSMTTLQAFAAGLPVIAARAAALPEVVGTERGMMFDPENTAELDACLEEMYQNLSKQAEHSENALSYAESKKPTEIAQAWEKLYTDVIASHRAKHDRT